MDKLWEKIKNKLDERSSAIIAVLFTAIGIAIGVIFSSGRYTEKIDNNTKALDNMQVEIDKLHDKVNDMKTETAIIKERVSYHDELLFKGAAISFNWENLSPSFQNAVKAKDLVKTTSTATSIDGITYNASDLIHERIITSYEEDGYQVFFCGQYDDSYRWDGSCVTNAYKDGVLYFAQVAIYESGERVFFEQIYADGDTWVFANRLDEQTSTRGETWVYKKTDDCVQTINFNMPVTADLIMPEIFRLSLTDDLISLYHGCVADGHYEDNTGDAYYILYDDSGYVKTLYEGNFENGEFNDDTGNAWYITRSDNTDYMYFKGTFINGHPDNEIEFKNPVSQQEINDLTKGKYYFELLNWKK